MILEVFLTILALIIMVLYDTEVVVFVLCELLLASLIFIPFGILLLIVLWIDWRINK